MGRLEELESRVERKLVMTWEQVVELDELQWPDILRFADSPYQSYVQFNAQSSFIGIKPPPIDKLRRLMYNQTE